PGFDDSSWKSVVVDDSIHVNLVAQKNEPIKIIAELTPVSLSEPKPGVYIFNLGQNIAGFCEITVAGKPGQKIQLRHGEMLNTDGTLYVDNLRFAAQTDIYVLSDRFKKPRKLRPHFTYHGFQYVEVTGLDDKPELGMIKGLALSSSAPKTGKFECSNNMLNKLWNNILWTQRDNMHGIPTDCPQRNERMGWMGDAQVFAQTAIFNLDMAAFYNKFIIDIEDAQGEEGMFTDFAPHPYPTKIAFSFGPGWADCGVIVPWLLYKCYGDLEVLKKHYISMKKYVELIEDENPNHIWRVWGSNYGDWLNGDTIKSDNYPSSGAEIPKEVFATLFYFKSTRILAKIAKILGKDGDHKKFKTLAKNIQDAFVKEFMDDDGIIKGDTQAGYAMALGFGTLPEKMRTAAVKHLIRAIKKYNMRLSTGFLSTIQMMLVLSEYGFNEVAFRLAESNEFPSWGHIINQGATTIWERWDGYLPERGFQDAGMNSFNHYSLGAIGEWIYRVILGINFDEKHPGMKRIILKPRPGGSLKWAKGSYNSIRGMIKSEWQVKAGLEVYSFEIPPNTTAIVYLPAKPDDIILEKGLKIENNNEIEVISRSRESIQLKISSGKYEFVIRHS
ncbi:MAG: family 78 glycoside hydrolase catalytic domain, partial [Promethearchaeota archaeon]